MDQNSLLFKRPVRPEKVLALGFLLLIGLGGLLLSMPAAASGGRSIGILPAFFTATSAVCVTGLSLIDAGITLSPTGQIILLCLIQVGGLGFMTFATLIMTALGKRFSLQNRLLLRDSMNQTTLAGMVRLSMIFLGIAIAVEATGAVLLSIRLIPLYGMKKGIWYSFFTAVSAFCNAGFDLFGSGNSLTHHFGEPLILLILSMLIVLGGLGFPVIYECLHARFCWKNLSLHAKLVLSVTGFLLISGTVLTLLFEGGNPETLGGLSTCQKFFNSLFQSVTLRTAGFASINQSGLTDASKLTGILFMFVGASSASTGGGVKTTTAAMLWLVVHSVIRGRERISVFGRELSAETARKSMAIVCIGAAMVLGSACVISLLEQGRFNMLDVLFETTSAFSTTGLSSIPTPALSPVSQWMLIPLMYLGRVGPLTLAFALSKQLESRTRNRVRYPEEKIMIG